MLNFTIAKKQNVWIDASVKQLYKVGLFLWEELTNLWPKGIEFVYVGGSILQ